MKKVSVMIDLRENEAFEKEVQNIICAKVRETVRDEYSLIIRDVALEEFKRLLDADTCGCQDRFHEAVKKCVDVGVKESLKELGLINLIGEKVTEITEAKINACSQDIERQCKIAFDSIILKQVEEKIKKILDI